MSSEIGSAHKRIAILSNIKVRVAMEFTDDLRTGIQEIDDHHQQLFDCLVRLKTATASQDRWSTVHYALVEMSNYVKIHFSVEEALMRLHGYPLLNAHIDEHRAFERRLKALQDNSLSSDVCADMVELLGSWLVDHIGKTDQQYVPHLRDLPTSIRPD